ncbi:MAG TPA: glycoside hydrolase family 3 C-terminal domain-containing protein [Bryobacteraceae bacterium]|nr:glycoside hydrolase family 3 C-terminal domain-containing protein [Bryobacteraceae bacterium]
MNPIRVLSVLAALAAPIMIAQESKKETYRDAKAPVEARVADLLSRMTLEEKVDMVSGGGWMESKANARLGIPAIKMADGPVGVRNWYGPSALTMRANSPLPTVTSTAFPAGVALGATWDPDLLHEVGKTIGQEAIALGRDMMLGPGVNIVRAPLAGRNFEMYGEDPFLSSKLVVGYIKGMQGTGVMATVKHFAANNQEYQRQTIDAHIDQRALHEIYLPAFRAAVVDAHVWSVMSAYNKLNGHWCAENPRLLTETLKKEWGFKGFVVSDWLGTHNTAPTANAGLDLEMPGAESIKRLRAMNVPQGPGDIGQRGAVLTPELLMPEVKSGQVKEAAIDDKIRRLLTAMFANGLFDHPKPGGGQVDTPEQRAVARKAADEAIVLLKNAGDALPLMTEKARTIAVVGPNANVARTGGGGSSSVKPNHSVSPLDAIRERAGSAIQVTFAEAMPQAAELAGKADVAIVFAGDSAEVEREGHDRESMDLPAGQDDLIQAVVKANKNTIVVLNAGAPVGMDRWIGQVPAVLNVWFPGEEGGPAIAGVLFGDTNPSGHTPITFPHRIEDSPSFGNYPGTDGVVNYAEGVYVGYRHYDTKNVEPLFCFGHGLSYTRFEYKDLKISAHKTTLTVRNVGPRDGADVVQFYVHPLKPSVDRPVQELKGFRRTYLRRGEAVTVEFPLDSSMFSWYDGSAKKWVADPGAYELRVGSSSRDIRLKGNYELK